MRNQCAWMYAGLEEVLAKEFISSSTKQEYFLKTGPTTMRIQPQIRYCTYTLIHTNLALFLFCSGFLLSLSQEISNRFLLQVTQSTNISPHGAEHVPLRHHPNTQIWHAIRYKLLNRDKHTSCLIPWTKEDSIPLQGLWGFCRTADCLASTSKWDPRSAETQPRAEILLAVRSVICGTIARVWWDEGLWGHHELKKPRKFL